MYFYVQIKTELKKQKVICRILAKQWTNKVYSISNLLYGDMVYSSGRLTVQEQVDLFSLLGKLMGTSTDLVPSFVAYREARLKTECALPCDKTLCINYEKRTEYFFRSNLLDRQAVACAMSKRLETNRENLDLVMDHFFN